MMPLGEVKEREPTAPKGMNIAIGKGGFPSYPTVSQIVVGATSKSIIELQQKNDIKMNQIKKIKSELFVKSTDIKENDLKSLVRDNNSEILGEISSLLSPEMRQFLTNRELKKHQEEVKQAKNEEVTTTKLNNGSIITNRFDLNGNLIILNYDMIIQNVQESLKNNSLFANLSHIILQHAAIYIFEQILSIGFIAHNVSIENEPELYGHQENPDLPGYTWNDIIELYRSEVPMQRSIALRIINGILNTRDVFSITECVGYEISKKMHIVYNNLLSYMRGINDSEFSSNLYTKKLKRLITYVLLKHFSSDLPTTLPTLILWGFTIKSISLTNIKLNTMKMLHNFLSCQSEEQININLYKYYDHLYVSLPKLIAPHTRRAEISYEEVYQDSISSINNINDDEISVAEDLNHEFLAYNCRYNRIDTLVHESDIIERITIILNDILKYMLTVSNKMLLIDNEMTMALNIILHTFQIYRCCVRLGDSATVQQIVDSIKIDSWKYVLLFIGDTHNNDTNPSKFIELVLKSDLFVQIESAWWHLIIEVCKRDVTFVAWLWNTDVIKKYQWFTIINESCLHSTTIDLCTWIIRFFRISILNNYGQGIVLNVIMHSRLLSQLENYNSILWSKDNNYGGELLYLLMEIYHISYKQCTEEVFLFVSCCHSLVSRLFSIIQSNEVTKNYIIACMNFIATTLESDLFSIHENFKTLYDVYCNNLAMLAVYLVENRIFMDEMCSYESSDDMYIMELRIAYNRCLVIYFSNRDFGSSKIALYKKYESIMTAVSYILPNLSTYVAARSIPVCEGLLTWKLYHLNSIYTLSKLMLLHKLYNYNLFDINQNIWTRNLIQSMESFGNNMEHTVYILLKELLVNETATDDVVEQISNNLALDMSNQYVNLSLNEMFETMYTLKYNQIKFNKNLPLVNIEWMFQQLCKLDGESFHSFLQLLVKFIDSNTNGTVDNSVLLYNLLVLVKDEHSFRWYTNIIEPTTNDNANMFLAYEPNSSTVQLYYNTLYKLIRSNCFNWNVVENFLNYCDLKWRRENTIQRKSYKKYREFIINIVDAISRQSIDPLIHSLVGVYFISPLFPVTIRFILWKELSHLRIIHVIESSATYQLLPLFIVSYHPWNLSNSLYLDLYDTIIAGVTNCVNRGSDIQSSIIVTLGIFEATKFMYNNCHNEELITDIFVNTIKYPDWLMCKMLSLLFIADVWNRLLITTMEVKLSNENWDALRNQIHEILNYNVEVFTEDILLQIQKKINTGVDIISLYNLHRAH